MSQVTHSNTSHYCTEKEAADEGGHPREKRPMVQEHWDRNSYAKRQKYRIDGSARSSTMSKEDKIAGILEECLSMFRSGLLRDIQINGLVFCEPSEEDDPETPPPLQSHTTTNTQFLQYEDWIKKLSLDADELDCEGFERCTSIKRQFLDELRNEWIKLEELKRKAWQSWQLTSQNADFTMPRRRGSDLSLAQAIDTCEFLNQSY